VIGIIADIHGNATALEAVLESAAKVGVSELFVLGDLIGYYHEPRRTLELLSSWRCSLVQGNHEAMLKKAAHDGKFLADVTAKYGSGLALALQTLDAAQIEVLQNAPARLLLERNGRTFLLCHGSPKDPNAYVYPDATEELLDRNMEESPDFILMGHTHYAMCVVRKGTLLLNPGSVGQPRDQAGLASWATVDPSNGVIVLRRTPFDITPVCALAAQWDPANTKLVGILKTT
jgi:putative phosphoesterase